MARRLKPTDTNALGLRALQTFRAIVQLGSVTAAARAMSLTQPASSRLLAQMEDAVGFELFYRDRGKLVLTADGLLLYEEVNRALESIDRVKTLARDISDFRVGQLKLVAPPSLLEAILPDIVAKFLERYPKIRLTIESPTVEAAKSLIASRAVDAGFIKLPINRPDLHAESVMISETACMMLKTHPLAKHKAIRADMLDGQPLVMLGLGTNARAEIDAKFASHKVKAKVIVETRTVSSACALAARGVGVAIIHETLGLAYVRPHTVLRRLTPSILHEYAFVTSAASTPSRLVSEFLTLTREQLTRNPKRAQ